MTVNVLRETGRWVVDVPSNSPGGHKRHCIGGSEPKEPDLEFR